MPAPGEQHLQQGGPVIANPFEEVKSRVSEYTAQEIATLQSRLEKQLGPEYISSRAGPSGQKIHYLAAEKCIQLANEVFGFNGWSSTIKDLQVDFVDENPNSGKVSLGLSVVVRVTLRDGTFHEDIGYGHIENCKGKAAAFEKAKKEGTTDGLKRALRNFGNVLGNCIYDKDYLAKVTKIKVTPLKWDVEGLHRHSGYMIHKKENQISATVPDFKHDSATEIISENSIEDEFGDFDEADFGASHDPDSHPDEVILPGPVALRQPHTHHSNGVTPDVGKPPTNRGPPLQTPLRPQPSIPIPQAHGSKSIALPQPQAQNQYSALNRTMSGTGSGPHPRPLADGVVFPGPPSHGVAQPGPPRVLHQPSRTASASAPPSPGRTTAGDDDARATVGEVEGPGFFSARGLNKDGFEGEAPTPLAANHLPAFDPRAESPSIRKTPGIDHTKTRPLNRDLRHVPGTTELKPAPGPTTRPNIINPQLDAARRIGAPGSPSPMGNRGMYKPPTMKRPAEEFQRAPLGDLSTLVNVHNSDGVIDPKRQRINGP